MEILSILIGGGIITVSFETIKYFVNRADNKKEKKEKIIEKLDLLLKNDESMQRGIERTQLMLLISDFPQRIEEIMEIAESYFSNHHGNYYLHSLFITWLEERGLEKPEWFK